MDSSHKPDVRRVPWWFTIIQLTPLVVQLVTEFIVRMQGGSFIEGPIDLIKVETAVPVIVSPPDLTPGS